MQQNILNYFRSNYSWFSIILLRCMAFKISHLKIKTRFSSSRNRHLCAFLGRHYPCGSLSVSATVFCVLVATALFSGTIVYMGIQEHMGIQSSHSLVCQRIFVAVHHFWCNYLKAIYSYCSCRLTFASRRLGACSFWEWVWDRSRSPRCNSCLQTFRKVVRSPSSPRPHSRSPCGPTGRATAASDGVKLPTSGDGSRRYNWRLLCHRTLFLPDPSPTVE